MFQIGNPQVKLKKLLYKSQNKNHCLICVIIIIKEVLMMKGIIAIIKLKREKVVKQQKRLKNLFLVSLEDIKKKII